MQLRELLFYCRRYSAFTIHKWHAIPLRNVESIFRFLQKRRFVNRKWTRMACVGAMDWVTLFHQISTWGEGILQLYLIRCKILYPYWLVFYSVDKDCILTIGMWRDFTRCCFVTVICMSPSACRPKLSPVILSRVHRYKNYLFVLISLNLNIPRIIG